MSLELHELVALARSDISTSVTLSPRPAASRAMPAPLMPPRMMRRSVSFKGSGLFPELRPPEYSDHRLGVGDDAIPHPRERIRDARLEDFQVLAGVEPGPHVCEAASAVQVDYLV